MTNWRLAQANFDINSYLNSIINACTCTDAPPPQTMERRSTFFPAKINTKWLATVASIWIQCTSGSVYTFSIYSPLLKSSQHYTQSTLDAISVFKDLGSDSGIISGLLYASSNQPWMVHFAGAVQCFLGYFLMWASVSGLIPRPPLPVMCLFMFVAAHAQTFFNTGNVVTAVMNFRDYGGTSVGIMKGFLGLSAAMLIQVYQTVFLNKPDSYLLMLAVLPTVNVLFLMYFVRIYDQKEVDEKKHLNEFSLVAVLIAAYLMTIIVLENVISFHFRARILTLVVLILLLLSLLPIAFRDSEASRVSLAEKNQLMNGGYKLISSEKVNEKHNLAGHHEVPSNDEDPGTNTTGFRRTLSLGDLNLLQAVRTFEYWLLFLAMICGMGSGLATVNNISQIGESLGYASSETSTLISLWSIWNFLGRFGAGYISDHFLHIKGLARPLFMSITLALMSLGHFVIVSGCPGALYAGSIVVGVCYGAQWSLMPTITSEIFGVRHMGTIFNTITMAGPVGSYMFSVRMIGYIYDKQASTERRGTCYGTHCFRLSFLIMASAALLGFLCALGLFLRTRSFYRHVILGRLQLS